MAEQEITCRRPPRNIAFDLLRLSAMLMVTMLHITGHGLREAQIEPFSAVYWIALVLNTFSLVAVNCFVLISGYFLSTQNGSAKKLAAFWLQVWTYSVLIYVILCLIPGVNVGFRASTLVECMFPLLSNRYWFFTCYFLLYLIAPGLNKLARSWDRREYLRALTVLIAVFSLIPSVNTWGDLFGTNRGYSLIWFVVLYLIAAYIRRFGFRFPVHPAAAYLLPCVVLCVFRAAVTMWNSDQAFLNNQCSYNGPLVLCASIALFVWAGNTAPKAAGRCAKMITSMASLSFGIYLLHDNGSIRSILWNEWVCLQDVAADYGAFLLRIFLVLIILFSAGLAAEFARLKIMTAACRVFHKIKSTGKNSYEAKKQN